MNKYKVFISILAGLYIIFIAWFVILYVTHTSSGAYNLYSNLYGLIPLIGGIYGLFLARRWGSLGNVVGRAILFLSLGLVTWGIGMVIWLYYNIILNVGIPYPSFADAAFILSWPLWTVGAVFLSIAAGVSLAIKNLKGKVLLLIIPIIISAFSYYFLVTLARQGVVSTYDDFLKTFFDLAYPIGDVVILTIATLVFGLSRKYLGGKYRMAIYFILAAFVINYFADFTFSYTTTLGTYYNGSLSDALFVTAMTLLGMGIAGFVLPDYKNQKFGIIAPNSANNNTIFHQILIRIIQKQESVLGLSAWYEATNVVGLTIDQGHNLVSFSGDGKEIVDRLIAHYEKLFGKASRAVCKEAVRDLVVRMSSEEIPNSLK